MYATVQQFLQMFKFSCSLGTHKVRFHKTHDYQAIQISAQMWNHPSTYFGHNLLLKDFFFAQFFPGLFSGEKEFTYEGNNINHIKSSNGMEQDKTKTSFSSTTPKNSDLLTQREQLLVVSCEFSQNSFSDQTQQIKPY